MNDERSEAAASRLLDLLAGKCRAQAVSTAAALGIADRLVQGPKRAEELAHELHCDVDSLERLLRLLVGLRFCEEHPDTGFSITKDGESLCSDALGPLAAFIGAPEQWDPWSRLRDALRSGGGVAFERTFNRPLYDYLAQDCEASQRYDAAIESFTRHEARALRRHVDFRDTRSVVDVGGGRGALLDDLLEHCPQLQGVLFDLPHVIEQLTARGTGRHGGRLEHVAGSFLDAVPAGGDVYILKRVLHNWNDHTARSILGHCASALGRHGRVFVIDGILAPGGHVDTTRFLDVEMLVLTGGRERRKPEFRRLFRDCGLRLDRTVPLTRVSYLMECSPRG